VLKKHELGSKLQELADTKPREWLIRYINGLLLVPGITNVTNALRKLQQQLKETESP
jgi:hypothetical protein